MPDYYELRYTLEPDQEFATHSGDLVRLDRRVPGDGTKWYVAYYVDGHRWSYEDATLEPGDLKERIL